MFLISMKGNLEIAFPLLGIYSKDIPGDIEMIYAQGNSL